MGEMGIAENILVVKLNTNTYFGDLRVDERIILKLNFKKYGVRF